MIYTLVSIIGIIISALLFRKAAGTISLRKINLISLTFYFLLIFGFTAVNLVVHKLDNHYLISKISDDSIRVTVFFVYIGVIILLPLVMLLTSKLFNFDASKEFRLYREREITNLFSRQDSFVFYPILALSLLGLSAVTYTFICIGKIPMLSLFVTRDPLVLAKLRIAISRGFAGNEYVKNILAYTLVPILSYITYIYTKKIRWLNWRCLFIILFLTSCLILTYNLEKAPILMYLFGFILAKVLIEREISWYTLTRYSSVLVFLFLMLYIFIAGINLTEIIFFRRVLLNRVFLTQMAGVYLHFDLFPGKYPFLRGQSFSSTLTIPLMGEKSIRSARLVMEHYNPSAVKAGTAGVINSLFVAEAYANFGWLGIFISIICVGFLIQTTFILFSRLPKNPLNLGIFIYLSILLPKMIFGGFADYIWNPGLWALILIIIGLNISSRMTYETKRC